ncbi:MAG TPA: XRE family transcriptional regulator [Gammaproteobacteria bacterium]|nr:XRE family transcriptional regulator [Gammaproteobacteria bacterium]
MSKKFNSADTITRLARVIRSRRLELALTIENIEEITKIDRSQISRFESGKFKSASKNLQIVCDFLQIDVWAKHEERSLGAILDEFASRSSKHKAAAEELLWALEGLEKKKVFG